MLRTPLDDHKSAQNKHDAGTRGKFCLTENDGEADVHLLQTQSLMATSVPHEMDKENLCLKISNTVGDISNGRGLTPAALEALLDVLGQMIGPVERRWNLMTAFNDALGSMALMSGDKSSIVDIQKYLESRFTAYNPGMSFFPQFHIW